MLNQPVSPVHVGRALESMRNSDFNTVSSIGEIIDNAIEAKATNIRIQITKIPKRTRSSKPSYDLTEIAFGDDGHGMSTNTLHRCLQLGFSDRYNDRKGIGRFGVGMTLGAITQCTRIEVYSKMRGGNWNFTYLDLDTFKNQDDPEIPPPVTCSVPAQYSNLVGEYGTLVIWKNLDREDAQPNEIVEWVSRTYRKFIGSDIIIDSQVATNPNQRHIFLDGEEISAFDPLYAIKTAWNDETSKLAKELTIPMEIHEQDSPPGNPRGQSDITIRMSLLPQKWRETRGMGGTEDNKNRRIAPSTTFSILRNDREVFFGKIPHYKLEEGMSRELDRFWGCEISFHAELDHWFSVKNIKAGARPLPELREKIQDIVLDTILSFRETIREVWDYNAREEKKGKTTSPGLAEGGLSSSGDVPASEQELGELIKQAGVETESQRKQLIKRLSKTPCVFEEVYNMGSKGPFIDIVAEGSRSLVKLNMLHPFWKRFYQELTEFRTASEKGDAKAHLSSDKIETFVLMVVGAFVLAKRECNIAQSNDANEFYKKLMHNWTYFLQERIDALSDDNFEKC